jgi:thioredoxin reductase
MKSFDVAIIGSGFESSSAVIKLTEQRISKVIIEKKLLN